MDIPCGAGSLRRNLLMFCLQCHILRATCYDSVNLISGSNVLFWMTRADALFLLWKLQVGSKARLNSG